MRRTLHRATRRQAIEIVEQTLQRTVLSCMADIDTDANIALLVFVLEPTPAGDDRISDHSTH